MHTTFQRNTLQHSHHNATCRTRNFLQDVGCHTLRSKLVGMTFLSNLFPPYNRYTSPPLPPHPYPFLFDDRIPRRFVSRNHFRLSENTHGNVKPAEDGEQGCSLSVYQYLKHRPETPKMKCPNPECKNTALGENHAFCFECGSKILKANEEASSPSVDDNDQTPATNAEDSDVLEDTDVSLGKICEYTVDTSCY